MQNFYFYTFYFFIFYLFYFFFFGGWAQLSPHGLGWTQLTRLGHWVAGVRNARLPNEL